MQIVYTRNNKEYCFLEFPLVERWGYSTRKRLNKKRHFLRKVKILNWNWLKQYIYVLDEQKISAIKSDNTQTANKLQLKRIKVQLRCRNVGFLGSRFFLVGGEAGRSEAIVTVEDDRDNGSSWVFVVVSSIGISINFDFCWEQIYEMVSWDQLWFLNPSILDPDWEVNSKW